MSTMPVGAHPPIMNRHLKDSATGQYRYALKKGDIEKGIVCADCGAKEVKLDGHHQDYARPLEVVWLCRPCHSRRHGKMTSDRTVPITIMIPGVLKEMIQEDAQTRNQSVSSWIAKRIQERIDSGVPLDTSLRGLRDHGREWDHFMSEAREKVG